MIHTTTEKMNRYYDPEFKQQAVELVLTAGKSIKQIAKELGCSASSLGEWKRDYIKAHEQDPSLDDHGAYQAMVKKTKSCLKKIKTSRNNVKYSKKARQEKLPSGLENELCVGVYNSRSKRSRFMTFVQEEMKSCTNCFSA